MEQAPFGRDGGALRGEGVPELEEAVGIVGVQDGSGVVGEQFRGAVAGDVKAGRRDIEPGHIGIAQHDHILCVFDQQLTDGVVDFDGMSTA